MIIQKADLKGTAYELLLQHMPADSYALVADRQTWKIWGKDLASQFPKPSCQLIKPGKAPQADMETVNHIRSKAREAEAIIAVGSGTINDLCKYAAFLDHKPYAICATAPSMNGYLSASASLISSGKKQSLPCDPPHLLLADLTILMQAPERLIHAGLGDSICRSTVQVDWLLSHLLLDTPYEAEPFHLIQECEERLLQRIGQLQQRSQASIASLMDVLLAAGKGMALAGGSYPASQGEHMIAHAMEELHASELPRTFMVSRLPLQP